MWIVPKLPVPVASLLLGACVINTNPPEYADDPPPPPRRSSSSSSAPARDTKGTWVKLGEKVVNGKNDHDDIRVGGRGKYRVIRIKVTEATMKMHDVVVEFADGSRFSPDTQVTFREGQQTGVIDLPGGAREIRRVGLRYSDVRGGGFAHVEVWAR